MLLNSVLTFLNVFFKHTVIVLKAEIEIVIGSLLHKRSVSELLHIYLAVPKTNLTVNCIIKHIHKFNVAFKIHILLFFIGKIKVYIIECVGF